VEAQIRVVKGIIEQVHQASQTYLLAQKVTLSIY